MCRICKKNATPEVGVSVSVDVTRIVKYVCVAAVLIIAIIFGTDVAKRSLEAEKRI